MGPGADEGPGHQRIRVNGVVSDRPPPLWERDPAPTDVECRACADTGDPKHRGRVKHRVYAGPDRMLVLVCPRCDGGTRNGVK